MKKHGVALGKKDLWTNWLALAGIDTTNYDSFNFIDNEEIMTTLMNSEEALNYLMESTNLLLPSVSNSQVAMTKLGESTKLAKVLKNLQVITTLRNSSYINKIEENLTRSEIMSSTETTGAKVWMSSNTGTRPFDGNWTGSDDLTWFSSPEDPVSSTNHPYVIYQFKNDSIVPYKFKIKSQYTTYYALTGKGYIEASKTGEDNDYVRITEDFNMPPTQVFTVYPNQNLDDYSYFKLITTQPCGNWQWYKAAVTEWEIYGK